MERKYESEYFPWYQIIWNLIWVVPYILVGLILFLIVFFWQGPRRAFDFMGVIQ